MDQENINKILQYLDKIKEILNESPKSFTEPSPLDDPLFAAVLELVQKKEWPEAVPQEFICDPNSEEDKKNRAESVIDLFISESMEDKKFLDYGCGEGYMVAHTLSQKPTLSIGYDVVKNGNLIWEEESPYILTTNHNKIKEKGPYDIILIYDVLDHSANPLEILKNAKELLAEKGKIYLRTHPWVSRHGGHLYQQMNKAFIHLIFTNEELRTIGIEPEAVQKTMTPIVVYEGLIRNAGLHIAHKNTEFQEVEPFVNNRIVAKKIYKRFPKFLIESENSPTKPPLWQMSQNFLDYTLTKS